MDRKKIQTISFFTTVCIIVGYYMQQMAYQIDSVPLLIIGKVLFVLGFLIPIIGYFYIQFSKK